MRKSWKNSIRVLLTGLLAFVLAISFVACGDKGSNPGGTPEDTNAPVISGFAVQADEGATYGKVGEAHKLVYTITGDCTSETVSVKKDGAAAAASTYEYTQQTKKIVFKEAGAYVVTLTAMNGTKGSAANANVNVTAFDAPTITTTVAQTAYQDVAIDLIPAATYATGDAAGTSSLAVKYCATEDGTYADATGTQYTYAENKFTAKELGYYKLTLTVTSLKGVEASKDYTVRCVAIGAMDLSHDYGTNRILVEKNALTTLNYTTNGGDAADFDIAYTYDEEKLTVEAGEGSSIKVTASENGNYTIKVVYTHKVDTDAESELSFDITVKDDIVAPTLGDDPFGGTWTTLIPNYGMLLYFDATDDKATIDYSNVAYTIVGGSAQGTATIEKVAGNDNYPYLVSTAEGDVEVRITVTDNDGNSSYAEKTFTVEGLGSGKAYANYSAYGNAVYNKAHGLNFDDGTSETSSINGHTKSVITKTGIIANRENAASLDACLGLVFVNGKTNFQIDYKMTVIALNTNTTGWNSLLMPLFAGPSLGNDGWVENFGINWSEGDSNRLENGFWAGSWIGGHTSTYDGGVWGGAATAGKEIYIRVTHTVAESVVTFTVYYSLDGETYARAHELTFAESTEKSNAGAPVWNIAINHVDGGVFEVSNVTLQEITVEAND